MNSIPIVIGVGILAIIVVLGISGFQTSSDSGQRQSGQSQQAQQQCDSSYPGVCIPPYPPDLDCGEIRYANFKVVGADPHGFDGDKDGIGCES